MLNTVEPPRDRPQRRVSWLTQVCNLWRGIVLACVGVLVWALLVAVYGGGRVWPGVNVLGLELGGTSWPQAVALLTRDWQSRTILLYTADGAWPVELSALGLVLDAEATAERAHAEGRSLARLVALLQGKGRIEVPPVLWVQADTATAYLDSLRTLVDASPQNATVRITGTQVEPIAAVVGRSLDVTTTLASLQLQALQAVREGCLELAVVRVSPPISDPRPLVAQAQQWLVHTLSVRVIDPIVNEELVWTVTADTWSGWMSWRVGAIGSGELAAEIDSGQVRDYLTDRATALGPDRYLVLDTAVEAVRAAIATGSWDAQLRVYHHDRQHIVRPGETIASIARDVGIPYPWILQANPGVSDSLRVGQVLSIPSPDVLLPLPVVHNKRIVVSISSQTMWAYDTGALLWQWPVSTGIESSPTSPGVFQVLTHEPNAYAASWDLWMPYFVGIYRPVPASQFMNGFHGFPTRDGTALLWTGSLGHPVTFGCILLSTQNAAILYEWAQEGTVVEIRP